MRWLNVDLEGGSGRSLHHTTGHTGVDGKALLAPGYVSTVNNEVADKGPFRTL